MRRIRLQRSAKKHSAGRPKLSEPYEELVRIILQRKIHNQIELKHATEVDRLASLARSLSEHRTLHLTLTIVAGNCFWLIDRCSPVAVRLF
jgi:hypothetical protein